MLRRAFSGGLITLYFTHLLRSGHIAMQSAGVVELHRPTGPVISEVE